MMSACREALSAEKSFVDLVGEFSSDEPRGVDSALDDGPFGTELDRVIPGANENALK